MTPTLARIAVLCSAALATLVGTLVTIGAMAVPAQARFDTSQQWGYAKVVDPQAYLRHYLHYGVEVLHVDTEHMDADGFWFAERSGVSTRGFDWRYQPFGAWCTDTTLTVEWNGWLNTYTCAPDWDKADLEYPGYRTNTDACRAATGHPWKTGSLFVGGSGCANTLIGARMLTQSPGNPATCAPWEDQGATPSGASKCLTQRYAWETGPSNSYWSPAPDTCTGLPAHATKTYVHPDPYVPAGPVPDCTGAALAPNCTPDSNHQACTGVPQVVHVASGTATASITDGTASATATKTAKHTATAYRVTKTAKAKYMSKVYKASRTVKIIRTATRAATVSTTVSDGTATKSITLSCSGATPAVAQSCATANAQAQATTEARSAAEADAATRAKTSAAQAATAQAWEAARQAVADAPVSKSEKKAAAKKATRAGPQAVKKQIATAKRRG